VSEAEALAHPRDVLMRKCKACTRELPDEEFESSDHLPWGLEGYCNLCFRTTRAQAWATYRKALKDAEIVRPDTCERCGKSGKIIGHHLNYFHPLEVKWVCQSCHRKEHREQERPVLYLPDEG